MTMMTTMMMMMMVMMMMMSNKCGCWWWWWSWWSGAFQSDALRRVPKRCFWRAPKQGSCPFLLQASRPCQGSKWDLSCPRKPRGSSPTQSDGSRPGTSTGLRPGCRLMCFISWGVYLSKISWHRVRQKKQPSTKQFQQAPEAPGPPLSMLLIITYQWPEQEWLVFFEGSARLLSHSIDIGGPGVSNCPR